MSQADANLYKRRRLVALIVLIAVAALVFASTQLFGSQTPVAEPDSEPTATAEVTPDEVTNCQPGVVEVEAFIGRGATHEALTNIPEGEEAFLWYEITNTGLVDCIFDVGTYATFFTITSGEQVFFSSRDCDRSGDSKLSKILKPNIVEKSDPGESWLKVYSSSEFGCTDNNRPVPKGGAQYEIMVEVSGVVSEKKLFYLF
jgi:hypothetical protein